MISINDAAAALAVYDPAKKIAHDSKLVSFKLFNKNFDSFRTDYLYVGKISNLPPLQNIKGKVSFLLLADAELPAVLHCSHLINYILLEPGHGLEDIINNLQDLFAIREYIGESGKKLLHALAEGKNIQKILNISYEILGNPVMLTDATHHLLAHAGWDETLDEPEWQHYLKYGYVSDRLALAVGNDLSFRQEMTSHIVRPVIIQYENIYKHPQIVSRVYANGINIAYLSVLAANKPFTSADLELASMISEVVSVIMQHSQDKLVVANTPVESFIIELLKNNYDEKYIEEKTSNFQLNFFNDICLIYLHAGEIFDSAEKMFFVKTLMQNFFVGSISVIYKGNVLVVTECEKNNRYLLPQNKLESFISLLKTHSLYAGISRRFNSLTEIQLHYDQAVNALKTGRHLQHPGPLFYYEDYFLHYLVDSILEHDNLKNICHPRVLEIILRDKEKSSNYAVSLYTYLQHNGDIQATAQAMHLHYNTMKYRLQKISEMLEADLNDNNTMLKCKLTFLALENYHRISFVDYFQKVKIPEETPYLI